jgi:serine protease Do
LLTDLAPEPAAQTAQQPSLRRFSQSPQAWTGQVSPGVVQAVVQPWRTRGAASGRVQTERAGGSGVVIDPEGYIVTNAHVVRTSTHIQVLLPERNTDKRYASILKPAGKLVDAELVGLDRETDIAVLKVAATGLPALKLGDSGALRQGELVLAAGSPFGLQNSVTMGIVSSVARQVRPDDPMIYIQTDAPINPGTAAALYSTRWRSDRHQHLLSSPNRGNKGVARCPSAIVRTVYDQIRKYGRVRRGQIGLVVQTISRHRDCPPAPNETGGSPTSSPAAPRLPPESKSRM